MMLYKYETRFLCQLNVCGIRLTDTLRIYQLLNQLAIDQRTNSAVHFSWTTIWVLYLLRNKRILLWKSTTESLWIRPSKNIFQERLKRNLKRWPTKRLWKSQQLHLPGSNWSNPPEKVFFYGFRRNEQFSSDFLVLYLFLNVAPWILDVQANPGIEAPIDLSIS